MVQTIFRLLFSYSSIVEIPAILRGLIPGQNGSLALGQTRKNTSNIASYYTSITTLGEDGTYVSNVFIEASFDTVWERITDPSNFPEIYPAWTTEVETIDEDTYRGKGPDGDEFTIRPKLNREFGIVDFDVEADGNVERSRSRLFDVDEHACELVHLAVRWEGVDDEHWERHERGTDNDLERMKRLIESESSN